MRLETCQATVFTTVTSAVVSNKNCVVTAVVLTPGTADACSVTLWDPVPNSTLSTGATIKTFMRAPLGGANGGQTIVLPISGSGLEFANGCVIRVIGTDAYATVHFSVLSG